MLEADPARAAEGSSVVVNVSAAFPPDSNLLLSETNVTVSIENGTASAGLDFASVPVFNVTIPLLPEAAVPISP